MQYSGTKDARGFFIAKCAFADNNLPSSVPELKGSAQIHLGDMRTRGHTLRPNKNGVYALQWGKDGKPSLNFIEKRDDDLIIYCHSNTSNYLPDNKGWKTSPNQANRILKLTWDPAGKTLRPILRLYGKAAICNYSFSLKSVKIP